MIDHLSKEEILKNISCDILPENVHIFDSIDSTNSYCKKLGREDCASPILVIADRQTNGRGRLGRSFFSPMGTGIYMSVLQSTNSLAIPFSLLTVAAGTAVCAELENICNKEFKIKWVNDIFADGRKVCGILAESIIAPNNAHPSAVVVGIGINISTPDFPEEIENIAGSVNPDNVTRNEIISRVINKFLEICRKYSAQELIDRYKSHSLVLGKKISFVQNGKAYSGVATDINIDGNLIVETTHGETITLKSGEVSLGSKNFV